MAVRDWVCTVCTAQNRQGDSSCRVCAAPRRTAERSEAPEKKTEKPVAPARRDTPRARREREVAAPAAVSRRARTLARCMNILWGAVLFFTALQWLTAMTLPRMIAAPAEIGKRLSLFAPGLFFSRLGQGFGSLWQQIVTDFSLAGPAAVWYMAVDTARLAAGGSVSAALPAQCLALTGMWALRLLTLGVAEADERITLRRPNTAYFTIIPIDLVLMVLALPCRTTIHAPLMRQLLMNLFTLQAAGLVLVLAAFLLIGAFTRLRMTRSILKGGVALVVMWFLAAVICAA